MKVRRGERRGDIGRSRTDRLTATVAMVEQQKLLERERGREGEREVKENIEIENEER